MKNMMLLANEYKRVKTPARDFYYNYIDYFIKLYQILKFTNY